MGDTWAVDLLHPPSPLGERVCSSRGCRQPGVTALRWNNPALHTPDRRKTWLACPEHAATLASFLSVRGFLRETVPVGEPDSEDRPR